MGAYMRTCLSCCYRRHRSSFFLTANATHSKRPTQGKREREWKTSKPPKRLFGNARSRACVPREAGEGMQALANVRAHPFDYLRASPASFLFLPSFSRCRKRDSLPLSVARETERTDGERRKHRGDAYGFPCAQTKKKHLHDKGASRRVKAMRRASRWNGVHWFYERSFDLAFSGEEMTVISVSQSFRSFSSKW